MGSIEKWNMEVKDMLSLRGEVQQGPWDPTEKYQTTEALNRFYSNYPMPPRKLRYRERFARRAIEEANKEYLPGKFKLSGEIMQAEMVSYDDSSGSRKQVPKEVLDAIRADGQQDVDAEDTNTSTKKDGNELEFVQTVGGAAQAFISGSPNSLGPPIEASATYLQMEKCGEYGRNKLNIWRSPLFPKMTNVEGTRGFLDNQITAIVWLLSRLLGELPKLKKHESPFETENRKKLRGPMYSGAILADSMGLGKTLTTVACLDLMARARLNVQEDAETGEKRHYPMLILCPNITVAAQWIEEILQSTSKRSIQNIIVSGGSSDLYPDDPRVTHLSVHEFDSWPIYLQDIWNPSSKKASRTVLIMSIDTWSRRTCISVKNSDEDKCHSTFTDLGRHFSIVCVDEAHKVKNASTRNWKSVGLLNRVHTLLVTATPCLNTITDLLGLARILWKTPQSFLAKECPETWSQIERISLQRLKILDEKEPWDDLQLAAGRPSLLSQFLCKDFMNRGQDIGETRAYLRFFESLAILRRGPGSFIFQDWEKTRPVSLEGLFPVVENWTVNIEPDPKLAKEYQAVHTDLLIDYIKDLKILSKAVARSKAAKTLQVKNALNSVNTCYRKWQIAAASMDVFKLSKRLEEGRFGSFATHISQMRNSGVTFVRLAKLLLEPSDPEPETAIDYLKLAVRGSPVLRYILHYIRENVLRPEARGDIKKLLITESVPILAYYYELVLQFLGINCRTFHADLSQDQRKELITSFNSKHPDTCQVLIQMYTVGYAGSNLHKNCARVLVASQAHSLPVQSQATHRVIRVGQTKDVEVYRLKVNNSFHAFRESRQIEKILPELGARAQGNMNNVLLQLLNLFQFEVDIAWKSEEGKDLMETMNLLSPWIFPELPPPAADQPDVLMEYRDDTFDSTSNGTTLHSGDEDSQEDDDDDDDDENDEPVDTQMKLRNAFNMGSRESHQSNARRGNKYKNEIGSAGWIDNSCRKSRKTVDSFLRMKTRREYYAEFKALPSAAKSNFDHKKNNLRRLLSYHHRDGKIAWTLGDLDNPAVLERAIELMLRVRLGAGHVEMLPIPLIDLPTVPKDKLVMLQGLLAECVDIAQDADAAQEQADNRKAKDGIKDSMKNIAGCRTLKEIDEVFKAEEVAVGGTAALKYKATKNLKRDDFDAGDGFLMRDIPLFDPTAEKNYDDDAPAEGDGNDWDDDDGPAGGTSGVFDSDVPNPSTSVGYKLKSHIANYSSVVNTTKPPTSKTCTLRRSIKRDCDLEERIRASESKDPSRRESGGYGGGDKHSQRTKAWGPPPKLRYYDSDTSESDEGDTKRNSDTANMKGGLSGFRPLSQHRERDGKFKREPTSEGGTQDASSRLSGLDTGIKLEPCYEYHSSEPGAAPGIHRSRSSLLQRASLLNGETEFAHGGIENAKRNSENFEHPSSSEVGRGMKREPDADIEVSPTGSRKIPRTDRGTNDYRKTSLMDLTSPLIMLDSSGDSDSDEIVVLSSRKVRRSA